MRTTRARYRAMLAVVGLVALAVLGCAAPLWPRGELPKPGAGGQADPTRLVAATLTKVARVDCPEADPGVPGSVCIKVSARLDGGRQVDFDTTDPTGATFRAGQGVQLAVLEQPGQPPTTTSATSSGPGRCCCWWRCSWRRWWPSAAGRGSARCWAWGCRLW